ncbi:protein C-terminal leucine carboxyl O-methyltransferase [Aureococcus anophagefferens]|nr:protein C-terminal leucine carboxyl O-methyltransferase [Aureococcus anophagefferens]
MELSRSTARAKRSCAEKGYVVDAFAPMFSEDTHTRTDPIMHRGYYARFRGVDSPGGRLVKVRRQRALVVLGCGLDSMFWRLHATLDAPPTYFEVDSEVVCVAAPSACTWRCSTPLALAASALGGLGAPGASADRGAAPRRAELDAVRGRFGDYEASDVRDMRAVYEALVLRQPAELRRISALEIFDDPDVPT